MTIHALQSEVIWHKALRDQLIQHFGLEPDDEYLRDTLEGLTDVRQCIEKIADSINEDRILLVGIEAHFADIKARKERIELRIERHGAILLNALCEVGLSPIAMPYATIGTAKTPAKVLIEDEALIPAEYMRTPEPEPARPDKKAIMDALDGGKTVPGATKSNGGLRLSWRTK